MVGEDFLIYGVQNTGECICETKNRIFIFIHVPQEKFSPRFSSSTPRQREITHFPQTVLFEKLSPLSQKKGGGDGGGGLEKIVRAETVETMTKIKLVMELVRSFDKSHYICTYHLFGYCFAAP